MAVSRATAAAAAAAPEEVDFIVAGDGVGAQGTRTVIASWPCGHAEGSVRAGAWT